MEKRFIMGFMGSLVAVIGSFCYFGILDVYEGSQVLIPMMAGGAIIGFFCITGIWKGEHCVYNSIQTFAMINGAVLVMIAIDGHIGGWDEIVYGVLLFAGAFMVISALWIGSDCSKKIMSVWLIIMYLEVFYLGIVFGRAVFDMICNGPLDVPWLLLLGSVTLTEWSFIKATHDSISASDVYYWTQRESPRRSITRNAPAYIIITILITAVSAYLLYPSVISLIDGMMAECTGNAIADSMAKVFEYTGLAYVAGCFVGLSIEYCLFYRAHKDQAMQDIITKDIEFIRAVLVAVLMATAVCTLMVIIPQVIQTVADQSIVITLMVISVLLFSAVLIKRVKTS